MNIDVHPTIIRPVVGEGDDKLQAMSLGRADDVVELGKTIGARVDGGGRTGPQMVVGTTRACDFVEAPRIQLD